MSTGMRKWMEKDCPDIPSLPAEVSIDREELRQLRDELAQYKNERDALRAKIKQMEKQEPYAFAVNFPESSRVELVHDLDEAYEDMTYEAYEVRKLYLAPGAKGE